MTLPLNLSLKLLDTDELSSERRNTLVSTFTDIQIFVTEEELIWVFENIHGLAGVALRDHRQRAMITSGWSLQRTFQNLLKQYYPGRDLGFETNIWENIFTTCRSVAVRSSNWRLTRVCIANWTAEVWETNIAWLQCDASKDYWIFSKRFGTTSACCATLWQCFNIQEGVPNELTLCDTELWPCEPQPKSQWWNHVIVVYAMSPTFSWWAINQDGRLSCGYHIGVGALHFQCG